MSDELEANRQKSEKWIETLREQPKISFHEIYELNELSDTEKSAYDSYLDTIGPYLQLYQNAWSTPFTEQGSKIKWLGGLLVTLNSTSVLGDKKAFVRKLFSKSLKIVCRQNESGLHIGRKSNEHEHILFELKVLDVLVKNGFIINLDENKLPSGKRSEFVAKNDSLEFHVEAKSLDHDTLYETIFDHPDNADKSHRSLNKEQQESIAKQFTKQLQKAVSKFINYDGYYLIAIDIQLPLNVLGKKLIDYLRSYQPESTCLGFIMLEGNCMKIYRNHHCHVNINDQLSLNH